MRRELIPFLILLFSQITVAQTSELAFSRNARTYETQHTSLVVKGLANACLTLAVVPDGLPCNPAMTPLGAGAGLGISFQLSNGYASLDSIRKILDAKITPEVVESFFSQGKVIQIEAGVDINFRSKHLNAQYSPLSIKGFSAVRNEANPDVDLYAVEEKGFAFQSGYELTKKIFAGIQVRSLNRKLIKQRFKLVALGTQAGKDLLKPIEQTATFIEPGATYFFDHSWKPRISVFVANSGFVSQKFQDLKEPVEGQMGLGISPPIYWGEIDLSLEYRSMSYEESDLKKLRFGALYHFGSMYLSGGIDSNGISGGVFYGLDKINAGVVYSTTQIVNQGASFYTQTVYVQLGWQI